MELVTETPWFKVGTFVFLPMEGVYGYIVKMMDSAVIVRDTAGVEYKKHVAGLKET